MTHLFHKHGGTITALHSIGHETYKKVATWHFVGDVEWRDGTKSKGIQIAPYAVCCDNAVDEQFKEWQRVSGLLATYLEQNGEWHEAKHLRDGRVVNWTPHHPKGEAKIGS